MIIAIAALLLFIMVSVGLSSCGAMFSGSMNSVLGTSYTSEDSDLVATEQSYAAMENELQQEIDNIESTHPGYDEYRYDLDTIGHNPTRISVYLTALLQSYTPQSAQAELKRLFGLQYTLTLTEEIEIRTTTDEEGNEEEYEYRILNVKLTNKPIASLAEELLNPQQFEMFKVYLQTQGNKPLIFRRRLSRRKPVRGFKRRTACKRHTPRKPGAYGACKTAGRKCGRLPLLVLVRL